MSTEIEGLNEIGKALNKIADTAKARQLLTKACLIVETAARENASKFKGNGDLGRSIESKVVEGTTGLEGVVFSPLEYAPYVEYGTGIFAEEKGREDVPWSYQDEQGEWHTTSGMKPQPFLRPALTDNKQAILRMIKKEIAKQ